MASQVPSWAVREKTQKPLALRPLHLLLTAFVVTLPASPAALAPFAAAPPFHAVADSFLFALLLASVLASAVMVARGLQAHLRPLSRVTVTRSAVAAYGCGTLGFVALLLAPVPLPWVAVVAGLAAGAALPVLLAEWARAVASTMERVLVLCAFVLLCSSFGGWILTLLPLYVLVPVYAVLLLAGALPLVAFARNGEPADPVQQPAQAMEDLLSVTWLPLLGLAVYAFMSTVMAHSAFGVMRASFLGGTAAAVILFGACFVWGKRPLLPWCYRVLVPLLAAAFVVLGAFPADTFPKDLSIVALYLFYLVLAALACALFLAVVHGRELPANVAVGFGAGVTAAAGLVGLILSEVLQVATDFGPWMTVLTGAFVAVLLLFLGRTAWNELISPADAAAAGAGASGAASVEPATAQAVGAVIEGAAAEEPPSRRDVVEARCQQLSEQHGLSPREAEILGYLARGFSPTYIAKELVLSVSTVRTHVRNIYRKLGIGKREELIHLVDEG